jgi:glycosyltransferase involved in cell wall biosynthesis
MFHVEEEARQQGRSDVIATEPRLRVLQVLEATLGGTRRYLEDVSVALGDGPENGLVYSLDRADNSFHELLAKLKAAGWSLFEIDMCRRIDMKSDARSVLALRRIYHRFKPDVVHAHSSKAGAIARLATLGSRKRPGLVYSPHAIGVNLGKVYGLIESLLALRLDVLSAVSVSERDELDRLNLVPSHRIHVVSPTIEPTTFAPRDRGQARRSLELCDGPLVIAIGRLARQKDPLAFVEFVAELRTRIIDVRAIWIGDGELRAAMEQRISECGLADVLTITGWLRDVRPYLAACDILVSTSAFESFGYATAEALAMDRPVVASSIVGTVDVVATDTDHQLYHGRNVKSAATLAERFLTDRTHAQQVAERGREHVLKTFSVSEMRSRLSLAYAAACARSR